MAEAQRTIKALINNYTDSFHFKAKYIISFFYWAMFSFSLILNMPNEVINLDFWKFILCLYLVICGALDMIIILMGNLIGFIAKIFGGKGKLPYFYRINEGRRDAITKSYIVHLWTMVCFLPFIFFLLFLSVVRKYGLSISTSLIKIGLLVFLTYGFCIMVIGTAESYDLSLWRAFLSIFFTLLIICKLLYSYL